MAGLAVARGGVRHHHLEPASQRAVVGFEWALVRASIPHMLVGDYIDAIIVIDQLQRIGYANGRASAYLDAEFQIRADQNQRLAFVGQDAREDFDRALMVVAQDETGFVVFDICSSCNPKIEVSVRAAGQLGGGNHRLIVLRNIDEINALRVERAVKRFALTPSEARILLATLGGSTPSEYAVNSGVKLPTVRSQLASLFAKTQTSRQVELVALIMQSPVF